MSGLGAGVGGTARGRVPLGTPQEGQWRLLAAVPPPCTETQTVVSCPSCSLGAQAWYAAWSPGLSFHASSLDTVGPIWSRRPHQQPVL